MSVRHMGLVLDHLDGPPPLKLVALIMADHSDSEGICWPSYRKIAERACQSERSIRRQVAELQARGLVEKLRTGTIIKQGGTTRRISNAYRIDAEALEALPKLSTGTCGQVDSSDHLEAATGGQSRWSPVTTKSRT